MGKEADVSKNRDEFELLAIRHLTGSGILLGVTQR